MFPFVLHWTFHSDYTSQDVTVRVKCPLKPLLQSISVDVMQTFSLNFSQHHNTLCDQAADISIRAP